MVDPGVDPETGLQYLRARYYDPTTAQFLTVDPLNAITQAPYSYAGDDPLDQSDPTGLCNSDPFSGSFWTSGNCLSGAVGGPNGGGSQSALWDIPAYGAVAVACIDPADPLCVAAVGASGAAGARGNGSDGAGASGCVVGTVGPTYPNYQDPTQPPGPGWEWRGTGPVGSRQGSWYNPGTDQSAHPDLGHGPPKGPHYDYKGPDTGGEQVPLFPGDPIPEL